MSKKKSNKFDPSDIKSIPAAFLVKKTNKKNKKRTRHSSKRAGRAMTMRIFFTSSLMKFTSSLSDLSVDY